MKVKVLMDGEADAWLGSEAARKEWRELHDVCPWGTVFQSVEFVVTWFENYASSWQPVVLTGRDERGRLRGLLILSASPRTNRIEAAGRNQAEYQVWLAEPDANDEFVTAALTALSERFPQGLLRLSFLPAAAPLGWLEGDARWGRQSILRRFPRPLSSIGDGSLFRESLQKKKNRRRLNLLGRMGAVHFERLKTPEELEAVFDEVMAYSWLWHGAVHGVEPEPDPSKKPFFVGLMRHAGLLHATVLRVGARMAAAHVGFRNKDQLALGLMAHSPFFAEHSTGKLHLLMLGVTLAEEGVKTLDLTPEGEYKERFATHHDDTHELTVYFRPAQLVRHRIKKTAAAAVGGALRRFNISPERARRAAARLRHKWTHVKLRTVPSKLGRTLKARLWETREVRVYEYDVEAARRLEPVPVMRRDNVADLLAYEPSEAFQPSLSDFLKGALENLVEGTHLYSHVQDGLLVHHGWLIERQRESLLTEVGQKMYLPQGSAVLTDFYTHPAARGRGLYRRALTQMLHDATSDPETEHVYIAVLVDNLPSRHVIEKVGFTYCFSFFRRRKGGRVERWTNAPEGFTRPA